MSVTYEKVLLDMQKLSSQDQFKLLKNLVNIVEKKYAEKDASIMQLEGLGKEIWINVDSQKYIDEERNSWNG